MNITFLRLHQEVNTSMGRGQLIRIEAPRSSSGDIDIDGAKALVLIPKENKSGTELINYEFSLKQLEGLNRDLKLDNTLKQLGI